MPEKTDDMRILTEFQKRLAHASVLLETAMRELSLINFSGAWGIKDLKRIASRTEEAQGHTNDANIVAREALAWCTLAKLEAEGLIEKGE